MVNKFSTYKSTLWLTGIVLFTALVYFPLFNNDFLKTWDDNRYILENENIQGLDFQNVVHLFTGYFDGHYHPLTLLSLAADYQVDGLNPKVFHFTNLLLHLISVLLVYRFVLLLCKKENTFVPLLTALLFGVATLHVESVAWATERKNVLYTAFFFGSLVAYTRYVKSQFVGFYLLALILLLFSLLSKSMAIPLCMSVVLIDYYFARPLLSRKIILEKVPFFVLAIGFGVLAVFAQKSSWGEDLSQAHHGFFERVIFAGFAFIQYIIKLLVPVKLSGFYPYPEHITIAFYLGAIISIVLLAGMMYFVIKNYRKQRAMIFGMLFFVFNIFLLLKLLEVPAGDYYMADRYGYVASVGLFFLITVGLNYIKHKKPVYNRIVAGFLMVYILMVSWQTFNRVQVFGDDVKFYSDIISKFPDAQVAYTNRGAIYKAQGKLQQALADFNSAIKASPAGYKEYANRGIVLNDLGDFKKAKSDFKKALSEKPNDPIVLSGFAFSLLHSGNYEGAVNTYTRVISIQPENYEAITNRGTAYYSMGKYQQAINDYDTALALEPKYLTALFNRGLSKLNANNAEGAVTDLSALIDKDPTYVGAYANLGVAYSRLGRLDEAFENYDKAINLNPSNFEAFLNRGIDLYYTGKYENALADLGQVIKLNNNLGAAWYFRGLINLELNPELACSDFDRALKLGFNPASKELDLHCK